MIESLVLLLITFLVSTVFFKLILSLVFEKGKYEKRLKKYADISSSGKTGDINIALPQERLTSLKKVGKGIEDLLNLSRNENLLEQSGLKFSLGELFIGQAMLAISGALIGYMNEWHFIAIILCAGIGFKVPILYMKNKRKKRLRMASEQLGEALGTMANALRAGFSFIQAMNMVAKEIDDPLGPEFLRTLQEINYGVSVEDSFRGLIKRLPDKELDIVLNTLILQRTTGGNLSFLMETMQETIFDRSRVKDEVKTLTAQGKMSAIVITLLPLALALYIKLVNPEYFQMLFSHPLGWAMVAFGSIGMILGWYFINKIVQIEV